MIAQMNKNCRAYRTIGVHYVLIRPLIIQCYQRQIYLLLSCLSVNPSNLFSSTSVVNQSFIRMADKKKESICENEEKEINDKDTKGQLQYAIEDVPPWYTAVILGFQVYIIILNDTEIQQ